MGAIIIRGIKIPKPRIKSRWDFPRPWGVIAAAMILAFSASSAGAEFGAAQVFPAFTAVVVQEGDSLASLSAKYLRDPSRGQALAEYNGISSLAPGQLLVIPAPLEQKGGLSLQGYQTVPVLSYHNFSEGESGRMTVNRALFERQMGLLRDRGLRVISMDEFFDFLEFRSAIPPHSVVITIDDGWRSAYEIAYPVLKNHGYPATLFIYTDRVADTAKTLSWNQLREMAEHRIETQCHTKTHRNLTVPEKKESFKSYFGNLGRELSGCRELIKKNLKREPRYLAYPYGDTNALVVETAKKLGYRGAFTIKRGGNPFFVHNFRVHRSMVYGDLTLAQFEKVLVTFQEERLE
jgi:peptidoglycan/xylan/chitin deacetylase (PgdA/CDA1 family)